MPRLRVIPFSDGGKTKKRGRDHSFCMIAGDTDFVPDVFRSRDVDLYDMYKIGEANVREPGTPHSGDVVTSPDTISVA